MGELTRIWVDKSLVGGLDQFRSELAKDLKKKYGLDEITIHSTLTSQILAAKLNKKKFIDIKIKKIGRRKGVLELL
jgi:hypothetical protein|tara:strand:- start:47 stop:274 length:228 start_codon:yes stop_codon:yes gene_type:complete